MENFHQQTNNLLPIRTIYGIYSETNSLSNSQAFDGTFQIPKVTLDILGLLTFSGHSLTIIYLTVHVTVDNNFTLINCYFS